MRRIIYLLMFLLLVITTYAHAESGNNWINYYKDKDYTYAFDSNSVDFNTWNNRNVLGVMILVSSVKKPDINLIATYIFDVDTKEYMEYNAYLVNNNGKTFQPKDYKSSGFQDIKQGTALDIALDTILRMYKKSQGSTKEVATGTGFFITSNLVVTNYHVVENANKIEAIFQNETRREAIIFAKDINSDLALIKVTGLEQLAKPLPIGNSREVKIGSKVFTVGFPIPGQLGVNARIGEGIVNSISGYQDDARMFQVSIPVQPGNSGGPLINSRGEVIGVVTSAMGAKFLFNSGVLPQNVNFAMKSSNILNMINNYQINLPPFAQATQDIDPTVIMDKASNAVVLIVSR